MNRTYSIGCAKNGGYYVTMYQNSEILFAGTLELCLDFIKQQFIVSCK